MAKNLKTLDNSLRGEKEALWNELLLLLLLTAESISVKPIPELILNSQQNISGKKAVKKLLTQDLINKCKKLELQRAWTQSRSSINCSC